MSHDRLERLVADLNSNPVFASLSITADTIIAGPLSDLESIYLIQLIAFVEDYLNANSAISDLHDFIASSRDNLTLSDIYGHLASQ